MIRDTSAMDTAVERPASWRRLRLVLLVVAVVIVLVVVVARPLVRRWAAADASIERSRLRLATVTRGDLVFDVAVQGRVVAASRPTLFSPAAGIVSLRVREGEQVAKGTVLAVLESPETESRLQQETATLAALRSDLSRLELSTRQRNLENRQAVELGEVRVEAAGRAVKRSEDLAGEGLLSATELEAARDALRIATIELAQARQKVELETEALAFEVQDGRSRVERQGLVVAEVQRQVAELTMRAPFDGLVATVPVQNRDALVRGQAVVGVVDLGDLEVEVSIPETYADDVTPGVEAAVLVDNETRRGTVTRVAPDVQGGQVLGRVAFAGGTPAGLRQNQRVSTRLVLANQSNVLKVARGPFVETGGGRWVYVVKDRLARRREIELGTVSVTEAEVVRGLEEGEEIVLSDLSQLQGAQTVLLR
jgi:HlyD family secretion protein